MNVFVELSNEMKAVANKVIQRVDNKDRQPKVVDFTPVKVAFLVDPDQKYTVCLLKNGQELTVGVAKRATYAGMADDYSEETGRTIAFSRAVRNFALGYEDSFTVI